MKIRLLLFALALLNAIAVNAQESNDSIADPTSQHSEEAQVYDLVEQMPSFAGGSYTVAVMGADGQMHNQTRTVPGGQSGLFQFLAMNVKYPVYAAENNIQGRVIASFVVERDGSIGDVTILKSVHPLLDKEAIRVIKMMPKWNPGMQKGEALRVKYTIPVTFRLEGGNTQKGK